VSELYGGVETGGTWCVCAVGSGPDEIVARDQFRTAKPADTIERITRFFAAGPAVAAVGIGSFGPVDLIADSPTWGHVTTTPKPGWQHVGIGPAVREALGVPVAFDLDVTAAAVGEQRWGAGQGAASLCYLTVGTGIGAGLLIDGRPWHGLVHPEVGHMRIPHDRARDPFDGCCPVHGDCWEGLAAGPALAARWNTRPEELPDDHPAWALESDYLAAGIVNIVLVFSPERIIIGGGVLEHPPMIELTRRRVTELLAGYLETPLLGSDINSYVVPPALGDDAGVLGAIALARMLGSGSSS
jgi:fructokinase